MSNEEQMYYYSNIINIEKFKIKRHKNLLLPCKDCGYNGDYMYCGYFKGDDWDKYVLSRDQSYACPECYDKIMKY